MHPPRILPRTPSRLLTTALTTSNSQCRAPYSSPATALYDYLAYTRKQSLPSYGAARRRCYETYTRYSLPSNNERARHRGRVTDAPQWAGPPPSPSTQGGASRYGGDDGGNGRDGRDLRDTGRERRDIRDGGRDLRQGRDGRDFRDGRDARDPRDGREARDVRERRDAWEIRDRRDARDGRGERDGEGGRDEQPRYTGPRRRLPNPAPPPSKKPATVLSETSIPQLSQEELSSVFSQELFVFRCDVSAALIPSAMSAYPRLRELNLLVDMDTSNIARQLHNRFRLDREASDVLPHLQTLMTDLQAGSIPGHPLASVHILSCLKDMQEYPLANRFWAWLRNQDTSHCDARVYGAIIETFAYQGEPLTVLESLYDEAFTRYSNTRQVSPAQARENGATHIMLLQGIITARLLNGDWRAAYEAFDLILRLYPTATPARVYELFIYERPVREAFAIFLVACRAGTPPKPRVMTALLKEIWTRTRDVSAMLRICWAYAGAGGEMYPEHLNSVIKGLLLSYPPPPPPTVSFFERKIELHTDGFNSLLNAIRALIKSFISQGFMLEASTFQTIITCAGKLLRGDLVLGALRDMLKAGIRPNEVTYRVLVLAAADLNDVGQFKDAWRMLTSARIEEHQRRVAAKEPGYDAHLLPLVVNDWRALIDGSFLLQEEEFAKEQIEHFREEMNTGMYTELWSYLGRSKDRVLLKKKLEKQPQPRPPPGTRFSAGANADPLAQGEEYDKLPVFMEKAMVELTRLLQTWHSPVVIPFSPPQAEAKAAASNEAAAASESASTSTSTEAPSATPPPPPPPPPPPKTPPPKRTNALNTPAHLPIDLDLSKPSHPILGSPFLESIYASLQRTSPSLTSGQSPSYLGAGLASDANQRSRTGYTVRELRFQNWLAVNKLLFYAELNDRNVEMKLRRDMEALGRTPANAPPVLRRLIWKGEQLQERARLVEEKARRELEAGDAEGDVDVDVASGRIGRRDEKRREEITRKVRQEEWEIRLILGGGGLTWESSEGGRTVRPEMFAPKPAADKGGVVRDGAFTKEEKMPAEGEKMPPPAATTTTTKVDEHIPTARPPPPPTTADVVVKQPASTPPTPTPLTPPTPSATPATPAPPTPISPVPEITAAPAATVAVKPSTSKDAAATPAHLPLPPTATPASEPVAITPPPPQGAPAPGPPWPTVAVTPKATILPGSDRDMGTEKEDMKEDKKVRASKKREALQKPAQKKEIAKEEKKLKVEKAVVETEVVKKVDVQPAPGPPWPTVHVTARVPAQSKEEAKDEGIVRVEKAVSIETEVAGKKQEVGQAQAPAPPPPPQPIVPVAVAAAPVSARSKKEKGVKEGKELKVDKETQKEVAGKKKQDVKEVVLPPQPQQTTPVVAKGEEPKKASEKKKQDVKQASPLSPQPTVPIIAKGEEPKKASKKKQDVKQASPLPSQPIVPVTVTAAPLPAASKKEVKEVAESKVDKEIQKEVGGKLQDVKQAPLSPPPATPVIAKGEELKKTTEKKQDVKQAPPPPPPTTPDTAAPLPAQGTKKVEELKKATDKKQNVKQAPPPPPPTAPDTVAAASLPAQSKEGAKKGKKTTEKKQDVKQAPVPPQPTVPVTVTAAPPPAQSKDAKEVEEPKRAIDKKQDVEQAPLSPPPTTPVAVKAARLPAQNKESKKVEELKKATDKKQELEQKPQPILKEQLEEVAPKAGSTKVPHSTSSAQTAETIATKAGKVSRTSSSPAAAASASPIVSEPVSPTDPPKLQNKEEAKTVAKGEAKEEVKKEAKEEVKPGKTEVGKKAAGKTKEPKQKVKASIDQQLHEVPSEVGAAEASNAISSAQTTEMSTTKTSKVQKTSIPSVVTASVQPTTTEPVAPTDPSKLQSTEGAEEEVKLGGNGDQKKVAGKDKKPKQKSKASVDQQVLKVASEVGSAEASNAISSYQTKEISANENDTVLKTAISSAPLASLPPSSNPEPTLPTDIADLSKANKVPFVSPLLHGSHISETVTPPPSGPPPSPEELQKAMKELGDLSEAENELADVIAELFAVSEKVVSIPPVGGAVVDVNARAPQEDQTPTTNPSQAQVPTATPTAATRGLSRPPPEEKLKSELPHKTGTEEVVESHLPLGTSENKQAPAQQDNPVAESPTTAAPVESSSPKSDVAPKQEQSEVALKKDEQTPAAKVEEHRVEEKVEKVEKKEKGEKKVKKVEKKEKVEKKDDEELENEKREQEKVEKKAKVVEKVEKVEGKKIEMEKVEVEKVEEKMEVEKEKQEEEEKEKQEKEQKERKKKEEKERKERGKKEKKEKEKKEKKEKQKEKEKKEKKEGKKGDAK